MPALWGHELFVLSVQRWQYFLEVQRTVPWCATQVSTWALGGVAEIILPILILCIPLFQVHNKCGIVSGIWTGPVTTCQGHMGPKRPLCLNLCKWLLWCQGVRDGNDCGHTVLQASHTLIWLVRCVSNKGGWCNLAVGVWVYPTTGWGTCCRLFWGRQWIYFWSLDGSLCGVEPVVCGSTNWSATYCGVRYILIALVAWLFMMFTFCLNPLLTKYSKFFCVCL